MLTPHIVQCVLSLAGAVTLPILVSTLLVPQHLRIFIMIVLSCHHMTTIALSSFSCNFLCLPALCFQAASHHIQAMCDMIGKLGLSASAVPATGPERRDETHVPIAPPPSPVLLFHPAPFNVDLLQIDALELEAKSSRQAH